MCAGSKNGKTINQALSNDTLASNEQNEDFQSNRNANATSSSKQAFLEEGKNAKVHTEESGDGKKGHVISGERTRKDRIEDHKQVNRHFFPAHLHFVGSPTNPDLCHSITHDESLIPKTVFPFWNPWKNKRPSWKPFCLKAFMFLWQNFLFWCSSGQVRHASLVCMMFQTMHHPTDLFLMRVQIALAKFVLSCIPWVQTTLFSIAWLQVIAFLSSSSPHFTLSVVCVLTIFFLLFCRKRTKCTNWMKESHFWELSLKACTTATTLPLVEARFVFSSTVSRFYTCLRTNRDSVCTDHFNTSMLPKRNYVWILWGSPIWKRKQEQHCWRQGTRGHLAWDATHAFFCGTFEMRCYIPVCLAPWCAHMGMGRDTCLRCHIYDGTFELKAASHTYETWSQMPLLFERHGDIFDAASQVWFVWRQKSFLQFSIQRCLWTGEPHFSCACCCCWFPHISKCFFSQDRPWMPVGGCGVLWGEKFESFLDLKHILLWVSLRSDHIEFSRWQESIWCLWDWEYQEQKCLERPSRIFGCLYNGKVCDRGIRTQCRKFLKVFFWPETHFALGFIKIQLFCLQITNHMQETLAEMLGKTSQNFWLFPRWWSFVTREAVHEQKNVECFLLTWNTFSTGFHWGLTILTFLP